MQQAHYRLEAKTISRGQGRSCVAAAAYRAADTLRDERQGMTHSYAKNAAHLVHAEIFTPEGAPAWMQDRSRLWNAADAAERRRDAVTARELVLSIPRQLGPDQARELVAGFVRDQLTSRGLVADVAIHAPKARDGDVNPHAHILHTTRAVEGEGFAGRKDRSFDRPAGIEALREAWANHCNEAFERAGIAARVDHRSLEAQRAEAVANGDQARAFELDREPEPKMGWVSQRIEREGREAYAVRDAEAVRQERQERQALALQWRLADRRVRAARQQMAYERSRLARVCDELMNPRHVREATAAIRRRRQEIEALRRQQQRQRNRDRQRLRQRDGPTR